MATALEQDTLLVDEYLPEYGFIRVEHRVAHASVTPTYEAMRSLDLMTVHSPITDLAMFTRTLPERVNRLFGREVEVSPPPATLRLGDLFDGARKGETATLEGWVPLAEERGRELVFGAVGKPWMADIEWKTVPPFEFASFSEPGWAKIAASVSVRPYATGRSILTYEARTAVTDSDSERRFRRYWSLVSPFVGVIMRAVLRTVDERVGERPIA